MCNLSIESLDIFFAAYQQRCVMCQCTHAILSLRNAYGQKWADLVLRYFLRVLSYQMCIICQCNHVIASLHSASEQMCVN